MTCTVNLLLSCILNCDTGPGSDENCFVTAIIFAIIRFYSGM